MDTYRYPKPYLVEELQPLRRSLRIAMVTESYPPEVNGVANSVARLVTGLRGREHSVQLVRPRPTEPDTAPGAKQPDDVLTRGMAIPMYGHLRMGLPCKAELVKLWTLRRPDLVHIATEGPLGWSALHAARKLRLPVCSDFRTNFHAYSQYYRMGWLHQPIVGYLRKFHNHCDCTMVPTEALRIQLDRSGFHPLTVVARGVDTGHFSPDKRSTALRQHWGLADDDVAVLHIGRLAAEKNLPVLVQAFHHLQAQQPTARLVIVGDGPARAELLAQVPQAIFAGFRSGDDLAAHYASSDLFLFPSLTETYGNVTPEAMASGLGIVAFDDAAAGELIRHRHSGMLAQKADAAAFVQLASFMAANHAARRAMGREARLRAQGLSWDAIVRRVEDIYHTAIGQTYAPMPRTVWPQAVGG